LVSGFGLGMGHSHNNMDQTMTEGYHISPSLSALEEQINARLRHSLRVSMRAALHATPVAFEQSAPDGIPASSGAQPLHESTPK
jgi:hypothetical protein